MQCWGGSQTKQQILSEQTRRAKDRAAKLRDQLVGGEYEIDCTFGAGPQRLERESVSHFSTVIPRAELGDVHQGTNPPISQKRPHVLPTGCSQS